MFLSHFKRRRVEIVRVWRNRKSVASYTHRMMIATSHTRRKERTSDSSSLVFISLLGTCHYRRHPCGHVHGPSSHLDTGIVPEMLPSRESFKERVELRAVADKLMNVLEILADVESRQHG